MQNFVKFGVGFEYFFEVKLPEHFFLELLAAQQNFSQNEAIQLDEVSYNGMVFKLVVDKKVFVAYEKLMLVAVWIFWTMAHESDQIFLSLDVLESVLYWLQIF